MTVLKKPPGFDRGGFSLGGAMPLHRLRRLDLAQWQGGPLR
jgi:hypothetical protein